MSRLRLVINPVRLSAKVINYTMMMESDAVLLSDDAAFDILSALSDAIAIDDQISFIRNDEHLLDDIVTMSDTMYFESVFVLNIDDSIIMLDNFAVPADSVSRVINGAAANTSPVG